MTKTKKIASYFLLFIFAMQVLSSCALFRKKNRCDDCPKWSQIDKSKAKLMPLNELRAGRYFIKFKKI